jgi:hypothetical protein
VRARKSPFLATTDSGIGGYSVFRTDIADHDALLSSEGIAHDTEMGKPAVHSWGSGWVHAALVALRRDSIDLQRRPSKNGVGRVGVRS